MINLLLYAADELGYIGGYGGYYYGFDWTYILVIIGAIITCIASSRVNSTFKKYSKYRASIGCTGAEIARRMLNQEGIYDVSVEHISGNLTDHYDPKSKVLRLSDPVYNSTSVAAISVAAHECGHAAQHAQGYGPLVLRSTLVPAANIGCRFGLPIVFLGLLFGGYGSTLALIGVAVFSISVLFQLVTLPVEFNASRRGLHLLSESGILQQDEIGKCKKVLGAAALTYVAAAASSILQLLRLLIISGAGSRRKD